jgi:2-polyprenyl-3-methyl-5-hydroxy-6-metoxy-1,4-benzoquinol methylase
MKLLIKKGISNILKKYGIKLVKINKEINDAISYNSRLGANKFYIENSNINTYYSKQRIASFEEILNYSNLKDGDFKVLDAGCGPGYFTNYLKLNNSKIELLGIDFSEEAIKYAKQKYNTVKFDCGDLNKLNFDSYNHIYSVSVLEHLVDPETLLINLFKSLKVNGKITLVVPNGRYDFFEGHIHFWSPESWKIFIDKCNLNAEINYYILKSTGHLCTVISKL